MEYQPPEHSHPSRRSPDLNVRRLHELTLLIAGLVWLDFCTLDLLGRLADSITRRHDLDSILLLSIFSLAITLSVLFGIILIYRHRRDLLLLPMRSYISYIIAAAVLAFLIVAAFHDGDWIKLNKRYAGLVMWGLFLLALLIPWALFRRRKPTPLFIDAVLVPATAILGYHALGYILSPGLSSHARFPQYFDYFAGNDKPLFLSVLILFCFFLLVILRRRVKRFWIYVVICLIAWACLILRPTVS